jgi:hypothetical protein
VAQRRAIILSIGAEGKRDGVRGRPEGFRHVATEPIRTRRPGARSQDRSRHRRGSEPFCSARHLSPVPEQPPDIVITANITIPDRQMKVAWSLRRNTDKSLPASHTADFMFTLPVDFPHGGWPTFPDFS